MGAIRGLVISASRGGRCTGGCAVHRRYVTQVRIGHVVQKVSGRRRAGVPLHVKSRDGASGGCSARPVRYNLPSDTKKTVRLACCRGTLPVPWPAARSPICNLKAHMQAFCGCYWFAELNASSAEGADVVKEAAHTTAAQHFSILRRIRH